MNQNLIFYRNLGVASVFATISFGCAKLPPITESVPSVCPKSIYANSFMYDGDSGKSYFLGTFNTPRSKTDYRYYSVSPYNTRVFLLKDTYCKGRDVFILNNRFCDENNSFSGHYMSCMTSGGWEKIPINEMAGKLSNGKCRRGIYFKGTGMNKNRQGLFGCSLLMKSVNNDLEQQQEVLKFQSKYESEKMHCVILIVQSINNNKWTIAGYNDERDFKNELIDDPQSELSVELKKEPANKNKIIKLVTSKLGHTRKFPRNMALLVDVQCKGTLGFITDLKSCVSLPSVSTSPIEYFNCMTTIKGWGTPPFADSDLNEFASGLVP